MLTALKELGRLKGKKKLYDEISADKVIVLEFDKAGKYKGIYVEDFKEDKLDKYLYKESKGSNPPTLTPTLSFTTPQKSLGNILKAWKKLRKVNPSLPELKFENGQEELERIIKDIPKNRKKLLTVKIEGRYIGEIPEVVGALRIILSGIGSKSLGKGVCSVCLEEKKVSGELSPFTFYTNDKPGYIAGGFNPKNAYKNFPVCLDCYNDMNLGREFLEKNLKFSFAGVRYYIIPEFLFADEETKREVIDLITEKRDIKKLSKEEKKALFSIEEDALFLLSEQKDILTVHILFLQKKQNQERIELYIQDIYPSRLKEIFKIKEFIESNLSIRRFTFDTVRRFFLKEGSNNLFMRELLFEFVEKIFKGLPFDEGLLISILLEGIRKKLVEGEGYESLIKEAFSVYLFSKFSTGDIKMSEVSKDSLDEFLNSLPSLDSDIKRALFLLGALTQRLVNAQERERKGKAPILKSLKGLKMKEKDVMRLLPLVREKLEAYYSFGYVESKLFEKASEYFSKASSPWNLTTEEINFYFALGMGMEREVKEALKEGDK